MVTNWPWDTRRHALEPPERDEEDRRALKTIAFVFVVNRFEEKMKWSRMCESMRTAK